MGVPGPRDDCRRFEDVAGMERWCGLSRRRFAGSLDGERVPAPRGALSRPFAVFDEGRFVFRGDGWRAELGWTSRLIGLLAIVVEGPALPGSAFRGVDAPVVEVERGGSLVCILLWFRSEGSWGSGAIEPSFWRSRILKSRRLICRSKRMAAFSLKPTFSS